VRSEYWRKTKSKQQRSTENPSLRNGAKKRASRPKKKRDEKKKKGETKKKSAP